MAEQAIVVAADAPGWRAPGARRFARRLAANGALVVTPDLHRGDTWYGEPSPDARAKNPDFAGWAEGHPPSRVASDVAAVITALRERGAKRVAAVGLGMGARGVTTLLAADADADADANARADAGAVVCPIGVEPEAAGRAAAAEAPVVFVWGGGDDAAAAAEKTEKAAEAAAGTAAAGKWASRAFVERQADFAFAPRVGEGETCEEDEAEAASLVLEWTAGEAGR